MQHPRLARVRANQYEVELLLAFIYFYWKGPGARNPPHRFKSEILGKSYRNQECRSACLRGIESKGDGQCRLFSRLKKKRGFSLRDASRFF